MLKAYKVRYEQTQMQVGKAHAQCWGVTIEQTWETALGTEYEMRPSIQGTGGMHIWNRIKLFLWLLWHQALPAYNSTVRGISAAECDTAVTK